MGLFDFKVDVVLARLEADFSDQPPSIPTLPNHQVSLQCPTAEYPCSAQPPSIPAVPNCKICLQCPAAEYPCSVQPSNIPAGSNRKVSLQCPTAKYACSAQLQSIPAVSKHQISQQGPTEKYPCRSQAQNIPGVPNSKVSIFLQRICSAARKTVEGRGGRETFHFLCNNGFRVGMLEVNDFNSNLSMAYKEYCRHHYGDPFLRSCSSHVGLRMWNACVQPACEFMVLEALWVCAGHPTPCKL